MKYLWADIWLGRFVDVHPHEVPALFHAFSTLFFLLGAYFVVLPLRDEAALSLGTTVLPFLFIASLLMTMLAAPASSYLFSLPHLSKGRALQILYRFFGCSVVFFCFVYTIIPKAQLQATPNVTHGSLLNGLAPDASSAKIDGESAINNSWRDFSWIYIVTRASFFIWIALLNLMTISAIWARLADVFTSEAGARLFGFLGAGATFGQLSGSLLAVGLARLGPYLLLVSAIMLEFAGRSALLVGEDIIAEQPKVTSGVSILSSSNGFVFHTQAQTSFLALTGVEIFASDIERSDLASKNLLQTGVTATSLKMSEAKEDGLKKSTLTTLLEGLKLILASSYLLHVCSFLWLTAAVASFFYFQRAAVVAGAVQDPLERRILLAEINSLTAIFILIGQLTVSGRLLTRLGVTASLCAAPAVAVLNLAVFTVSPSSMVVAVSEAIRKVVNYVATRPGREVLFTVISREEKYKAKVCVDTFVLRLGDAAAAGVYKLLENILVQGPSAVALCALPISIGWLLVAWTLGQRHVALAKAAEI